MVSQSDLYFSHWTFRKGKGFFFMTKFIHYLGLTSWTVCSSGVFSRIIEHSWTFTGELSRHTNPSRRWFLVNFWNSSWTSISKRCWTTGTFWTVQDHRTNAMLILNSHSVEDEARTPFNYFATCSNYCALYKGQTTSILVWELFK